MIRALMILLLTATIAQARAIDEVNYWRQRMGLRPYIEDPNMTAFAQRKAEWQARNGCGRSGHAGPRSRWDEGTSGGGKPESIGWATCLMDADHVYAGAGVAYRGNRRYMVMVARGGSGRALLSRRRALPLIPTAHLTPRGGGYPVAGGYQPSGRYVCPKCGRVH